MRKPKLMTARFAGKCRGCGKQIDPGETIYFSKRHGTLCPPCGREVRRAIEAAGGTPEPASGAKSRLIRMTRDASCKACGAPIGRGQMAFYAGSREAGYRCVNCGKHPDTGARAGVPQPTPTPEPSGSTGKHPAVRCADGVHRVEHHSLAEALADAFDDYAQSNENRLALNAEQNSCLGGTSRWGNYFTKDRLLAELGNPGQQLLQAVDEMREQLTDELDLPTTPRRKVVRGQDWGDEMDADRWLRREPACWDRNTRPPSESHTITIGVNVSVNARQRPEELLYRGAAALALADVLVSRGVNVGIVAFKAVDGPTDEVRTGVAKIEVKDPLMPLDIASVAFALCEIAFARAVVICGQMRHWPGRISGGWGTPCRLPRADKAGIDYLIDYGIAGREAAVAWLKEQMGTKEVANV